MSDVPERRADRQPVRTLQRSRTQRIVAGVCGGLAEYLGVDPVLVRIAFVVLALAGGGGIVLYVVGWILMPEEAEPGTQATGEPRAPRSTASPADSARLVIGGVLIWIGFILLVNMLAPSFGKYFWPLALIGVGFAVIVQASRSRS